MELKIEQPNWFNAQLIHNKDNQLSVPVGKVVCVGRNYVAHAKELNNSVPDVPLLFIKPNSSLSNFSDNIEVSHLPYKCHYEAELALLIGKNVDANAGINDCVAGIGLALDLTFRDLQAELKAKGHPWEKSKSFAGSCPVTPFIALENQIDLTLLSYYLKINEQTVQQAITHQMIFPIEQLIKEAANCFGLVAGDIILTGTPSGVGQLDSTDKLELGFNEPGITDKPAGDCRWFCNVS